MEAIYKCRLCGALFAPGYRVPARLAEDCMDYLVAGIKGAHDCTPTMHAVHRCETLAIAAPMGLGDFCALDPEAGE